MSETSNHSAHGHPERSEATMAASDEATDSSVTAEGFRALLEARWSCREFLPQAVDDDTIAEMFEIGQRTASWCNTQPWHVYVASGSATKRLASLLTDSARAGGQNSDFPPPAEYRGVYQERRRAAGFALYDSLSIEKSDYDGRAEQMLRNFSFFGAPHVAVIATDRDQGVYGAVDCGGYVANLLNAASSLGVATIPQAAIAMQSDQVREFFDIPEDQLVVCAMSFGYADLEHPVNQFRTERADVAQAVTHFRD